jgi:hypothetical protein
MQRIRKHLSYANVIATFALVFAMTGGAIAATGGFTSNGTIKACVNEEGGLKLLKAGKHCKRGQKTVAWNQTGPVGAKGAAGSPGAPGATGATGDTKWASVNEDGLLLGSKGVTGVKNPESPYDVSFDRDVSKCAVTATSNDVIPTNRVGTAQHISAETIRIRIRNAANEEEAAPFSIVAVCP